jgi:protein tyrosine/serine phosphatase
MNVRTALRLSIPVRLMLLAMMIAPGASAGPQQGQGVISAPHHVKGTRLSANGIPNFAQVSSNLYRGGLPDEEGIQQLKKLGIAVVIDMRRGQNKSEEEIVSKLGMQYVSIPSRCPFPSDDPWARFLKVMRENQNKKVFVHCRLGADRTGMAVAAYRMSEEGWSADEALEEMKAFGFSRVHRALCPGLESYEEDFPKRLKESSAFRELSMPSATPSK